MVSNTWWSWLKQFGAALCPRSAPRRRRGSSNRLRCRLRLEMLENRLVPSNVWIGDSSAIEPSPQGTVNMYFPLARDGDLSAPLTVAYTTVAGSAQAYTDFTPTSGTVTFAAGASTAVVTVPIFGNGVYNNPNLTFSVQLTGFVGAGTGGSLSFANHVDFPVGTEPDSVALGDLNGNGKPDIVVANGYSNTVTVLMNTTPPGATTPSFAPAETFAVGDHPRSVVLADLNEDGLLDIVTANYYDNTVSVLMNTTPPLAALASFAAQQKFDTGFGPGTGVGPLCVTVADLNGDGRPDIVAGQNSGTVAVLLNTTPPGAALASFAPHQDFDVYGEIFSVAVGDINGDGKPDIVTTNDKGAPGNGTVSVLLNTTPPGAATLSFAAPQIFYPSYPYPGTVDLADLNGDGRPDIVVGDTVSVLLNTTPPGATFASFAAAQPFNTGTKPIAAVGDINGDGKPDIVTANYYDNTASVLLNTTPPLAALASFAAQQTFPTGTKPDAVAVGDINGLGGNDTLIVSLANGAPLIAGPGPIYFDGSSGSNTLTVDAAGQSVQAGPGTLTIGQQTIVFANVASTNLVNAVALGASAGPDTADRAIAFAGLTANERYVQALFLDELGRAGTKAELDYWAAQLDGSTYEQTYVAYLIEHSGEACDHLVQSWYVSYLGRQPANDEEQGWVAALLAGQSEEQVLSALLSSAEFYNRAQTLVYTGTADQRYVQALFQVLLNRTDSAAEAAWGEDALAQLGQPAVVLSILTGPEFRTDQFTGYYEGLLQRPPDAAGLSFWVMSHFDMAGVRLGFEFSSEFFLDG